jgi:predicted AlkP superfamily phosphohydrolase/phosphomutase
MSGAVVVIGLDAMDSGVARALIAGGRMPSLAAFLESAAWAPTENPRGLLVGGVWPTITTGCGPDRHGFYCDLQIQPHTYEAWRRDPTVISVPHVWDVLGAAGKQCAVLDVPVAQLSRRDDVVQLIEWGTHDRLLPLGSNPSSLADEIVGELGTYPVQPKCDDYTRRRDPAGLLSALCAGVAVKERLVTTYLDRGPWDLLWCVFGESHCAGHQLWALHDQDHPDHDSATRAELGDPLHRVYETIDAALGRVLAKVGDATVIVLLSHGMGRHDDGEHLLGELLRRFDVAEDGPHRLVALERAYRRGQRRARQARRARPLEGERRFFKVPNNELYGAIRINVKGREPRGRVTPGPELDAVIAQLREDLLAVENTDTGAPLIRDVWRTDDWYDGPRRDALPDLFVDWNRGGPMRRARSPKVGVVEGATRSTRTGDHRPTGLLAVRSHGVAPGELLSSVRAVDIAPTIAAFLGVTMPDAQGQPLTNLTAAAPGREPARAPAPRPRSDNDARDA